MKNYTIYCNSYIRSLIKSVGGTPRKCTATIEYAVDFTRVVPVITIRQDLVYLLWEKTALVDFCDEMNISLDDAKVMIAYYRDIAFQHAVNDIEYEEECFNRERLYDEWMAEELAWYNHARMMGWE